MRLGERRAKCNSLRRETPGSPLSSAVPPRFKGRSPCLFCPGKPPPAPRRSRSIPPGPSPRRTVCHRAAQVPRLAHRDSTAGRFSLRTLRSSRPRPGREGRTRVAERNRAERGTGGSHRLRPCSILCALPGKKPSPRLGPGPPPPPHPGGAAQKAKTLEGTFSLDEYPFTGYLETGGEEGLPGPRHQEGPERPGEDAEGPAGSVPPPDPVPTGERTPSQDLAELQQPGREQVPLPPVLPLGRVLDIRERDFDH